MPLEKEILQELKNQNRYLKDIVDLLRQQLAFWNKISSEDYYSEVVANDGFIQPKK